MIAHELGRRAALLYVKLAESETSSSASGMSAPSSSGSTGMGGKPGGAASATAFGGRAAPVTPKVPQLPPATPAVGGPPATPAGGAPGTWGATHPATAAPGTTGGGVGGTVNGALGTMKTPQGQAAPAANPALNGITPPPSGGSQTLQQAVGFLTSGPFKPYAEQAMQIGGMPLLAAGTNMLRGGGDFANLMRGKPGGAPA